MGVSGFANAEKIFETLLKIFLLRRNPRRRHARHKPPAARGEYAPTEYRFALLPRQPIGKGLRIVDDLLPVDLVEVPAQKRDVAAEGGDGKPEPPAAFRNADALARAQLIVQQQQNVAFVFHVCS